MAKRLGENISERDMRGSEAENEDLGDGRVMKMLELRPIEDEDEY